MLPVSNFSGKGGRIVRECLECGQERVLDLQGLCHVCWQAQIDSEPDEA